MQSRRFYLAGAAAVAAVGLAIGATAAGGSGERASGERGHDQLISESALLAGLASNSLFPFVDTTPNTIRRTHITITDSTAACSAGAAPPARIQVLVGEAGVALTNVMTAATNTGIGTAAQCVFHITTRPGQGGVPGKVTDVVVRNAGGAPLTGIHTVTASATVRPAH
jgi:hypothetical protein